MEKMKSLVEAVLEKQRRLGERFYGRETKQAQNAAQIRERAQKWLESAAMLPDHPKKCRYCLRHFPFELHKLDCPAVTR